MFEAKQTEILNENGVMLGSSITIQIFGVDGFNDHPTISLMVECNNEVFRKDGV